MVRKTSALILVLASTLALTVAVRAQDRPTMAIMPTQYFKAGPRSAERMTRSLVERFEAERYDVIPMDRSLRLFQRMRLSHDRPISDATLLQFGRRLGADLVAHPQLLAVRPWQNRGAESTDEPGARAVLYLRVLNTRTGSPLYTRQVAYSFTARASETGELIVPPSAAAGAVAEVSRPYFERVAGSRQEYRAPAGR
jgi:hypothetical protein